MRNVTLPFDTFTPTKWQSPPLGHGAHKRLGRCPWSPLGVLNVSNGVFIKKKIYLNIIYTCIYNSYFYKKKTQDKTTHRLKNEIFSV